MVRIIGIRNMVFHIWYIPVYIYICVIEKLIIYLHFTKSLKHDSIYKLCLWLLGEHIYLVLVLAHVKAPIYSTHVQDYRPTLLLHCAEPLRSNNIYLLHLSMVEEHV